VVLIALIVVVEKLMPFGERSAQLTGAGLGLLAAFVAVYPDLSKFERHRWTKSVANAYPTARIDLKRPEIDLGGRKRLDFGTVRPRVQIPGPDDFRIQNREFWTCLALAAHSRITISQRSRNRELVTAPLAC
jgi:hypothetical protein